jgi:hypothetical protein
LRYNFVADVIFVIIRLFISEIPIVRYISKRLIISE